MKTKKIWKMIMKKLAFFPTLLMQKLYKGDLILLKCWRIICLEVVSGYRPKAVFSRILSHKLISETLLKKKKSISTFWIEDLWAGCIIYPTQGNQCFPEIKDAADLAQSLQDWRRNTSPSSWATFRHAMSLYEGQ